MKITVKHICGHEEDIEVYGTSAKRDWKIKCEEEHYCALCEARRFEARVIDRLQAVTTMEALPVLKGTSKQVTWANDLRLSNLSNMLDALDTANMQAMAQTNAYKSIVSPLKALVSKLHPHMNKDATTPEGSYNAMVDALKKAICVGVSNDSVKYWIDNRENNYALAGYLLANISDVSPDDIAKALEQGIC